jgi:AcrR family transcriptional regulator
MSHNDRKNEVFQAALQIFSEYGFKKTTIEDIALKLGLTKGALYLYAKDKKDLYKEAVKYGLLQWQNKVLVAIQATQDIEERFMVLCKTAFRYLAEDKVLRKIMIQDPDIFPMSFSKDPYQEVNNDSMKLMKSILDQGVKEGRFQEIDTATLTKIFFSIYKMLIIETYVLEESDANQMFDATLDILTKGFFTGR